MSNTVIGLILAMSRQIKDVRGPIQILAKQMDEL
jgi:hypothetical protein